MGVPGNADLLLLKTAAAAGGYQVSRSLRFYSADSAYLSKNFASAGNRKTFTWSAWIKRSRLAGFQVFFSAADASSEPNIDFDFNASDKLRIRQTTTGGAEQFQLLTTQVFRDISAWYHIVIAFDTTQATASNRIKLYVNGSQVTAFDTSNYPSQNLDTHVTGTAYQHAYGRLGGYSDYYFDGYLAECHLIDGQQLDASSFGSTDATTGQWIPKLYSGSYGTNGFKLTFSDNSAATAAALGKDSAGSNNWTPNNFSVTAGAGNDSLVDTPTSYGTDDGLGGSVRGNYCTWNPLNKGANISLANGNLDASLSSTNDGCVLGTIGMSTGKWYWEIVNNAGSRFLLGIATSSINLSNNVSSDAYGWAYFSTGVKRTNNSGTSYGATYTTGDVIGVAFDADNGTLTFYKNGTSQGTAFTGLTSGPYFAAWGIDSSSPSCSANFGQRQWAYQAPAGFKALVDTNLTAPVIAKPNTVMDVLVFAATNANNTSITGLNFQPDLVWGKSRTNAYSHQLYDSVRGVNKNLKSNTTGAEVTDTVGLTSFDSNGFTAGVDFNVILGSGSSVAWCWDAGSSTVTNTQGSITSQVRANASAGFSIVTYTGTNVAATIGHGLGVEPHFIICKSRSGSTGWLVYHKSLGNTNYLILNATDASAAAAGAWNNTTPTSSVFTIGTGSFVNTNGATQVSYCFAPVAGYSSMGSYVGNGSSDGVFVYTGHRIRFLLIKNTTLGGSNWRIIDTARNPYNVANLLLNPNSSNAEQTTTLNTIDLLSNGFKCRGTDGDTNSSGDTFIYYAVAENPFQYARAR